MSSFVLFEYKWGSCGVVGSWCVGAFTYYNYTFSLCVSKNKGFSLR